MVSTKHGPMGIGIIGAGAISDQYLRNLTRFPDLRVLAIGNRTESRAHDQAAKYSVPVSGGTDVVFNHPEIELVVNLTTPSTHASISNQALSAGKHVWSEKPLGLDRVGAQELLALAKSSGLRVGVAPDTVLGPGLQTAKRAISRGDIGQPLFAQTTFQWQGPEIFHPNPAFLYAAGAGPLLDIGPYYVSALAHLFGSVQAVAALGLQSSKTRSVQVGELAGESFAVEVPTTLQVLMQFVSGMQSQSLYSTDSPLLRHGVIEISGTLGTISLPDPNVFTGPSTVTRPFKGLGELQTLSQETIDIAAEGTTSGRGLGVVEMARAIREERPHQASAELGYHVLDTLLAIEEAAAKKQFVNVESRVEPQSAMPVEFNPYQRTLNWKTPG